MSEAKETKEISVEDKLRALYDLQLVASEIDKIKTLRGELPLEVQDLEDEIAGLNTRIAKYESEIKDAEVAVSTKKKEIENSKSLIEKYKAQLDNVRNNREFENLEKEIEFQGLEIELSEKRIRENNATIKEKQEELEKVNTLISDKTADLNQKKAELDEIVSETKQEEEKLRERAKTIEANIDQRLLSAFKRIRKNARNGLAVVYVQRDACGGCFNQIPPQRQMDIRLRKKVIVCEYCGRILIDPELADAESNNFGA
ncbi:MAG: HalX domain-containing protein [Paludibacteraceae bacterium]|nr:HalX domain-containing protein [Paludibacteraceae bacterium]MBR4839533.1 HalX domain-containing protein [Paludibacteraceae bacterium]